MVNYFGEDISDLQQLAIPCLFRIDRALKVVFVKHVLPVPSQKLTGHQCVDACSLFDIALKAKLDKLNKLVRKVEPGFLCELKLGS